MNAELAAIAGQAATWARDAADSARRACSYAGRSRHADTHDAAADATVAAVRAATWAGCAREATNLDAAIIAQRAAADYAHDAGLCASLAAFLAYLPEAAERSG